MEKRKDEALPHAAKREMRLEGAGWMVIKKVISIVLSEEKTAAVNNPINTLSKNCFLLDFQSIIN